MILDTIAKGRYSDKELQDIRKKLKDILNILKLYVVELETPPGIRTWNKRELEEQLGHLNDLSNELALLTMEDIHKQRTPEKKI